MDLRHIQNHFHLTCYRKDLFLQGEERKEMETLPLYALTHAHTFLLPLVHEITFVYIAHQYTCMSKVRGLKVHAT